MLLDQSAPHIIPRWVFLVALLLIYGLRVYFVQGFYIVTYGLGIYLLNLFIGFLQPQDDPTGDGPALPQSTDEMDDFRPFRRRVPEFRFWWSAVKSVFIALGMTFFPFFDIPVFWPILLLYFILLCMLTMKRQIKHMIKHKYVPWSWGKKSYKGGEGQTIKKKKPVAPMPKLRAPLRSMPAAPGLKKISRD